jgi:hypothetical protein
MRQAVGAGVQLGVGQVCSPNTSAGASAWRAPGFDQLMNGASLGYCAWRCSRRAPGALLVGGQHRQLTDALRGSATMACNRRSQCRAMRSMVGASNRSLA